MPFVVRLVVRKGVRGNRWRAGCQRTPLVPAAYIAAEYGRAHRQVPAASATTGVTGDGGVVVR